MGWQIQTFVAALLASGAVACASDVSAQMVLLPVSQTTEAAASQAGGMQIQTLIGGPALENTDHAAVIRLGPADYPFEPGDEIGLPIGSAMSGGSPVSCLTQAIYYEARSESLEGQEAVAQVVLNRTRDGRFPKSVCRVVFQGQERRTGCQFTFVCDGSLGGRVQPDAWSRAKSVAERALGGFEYKPLVGATHYHAAWMTPYWSSSLTKVRQIGGHIFYR